MRYAAEEPGNDPYIVFDHGTDADVRTSFRGDLNPPQDTTEGDSP